MMRVVGVSPTGEKHKGSPGNGALGLSIFPTCFATSFPLEWAGFDVEDCTTGGSHRMGNAPRVVERPRKDPPTLAELAALQGQDVIDFLADVTGRHPTYDAAAAECGVSRRTFLSWRKRYNVRGA